MLTIHIGPPKTATSSLQDAIQNGASTSVAYLGIQQPRADFESIIHSPQQYCAEALYLKCAYPDLDVSFSDLLIAIKSQLVEHKAVCISEEMFLTDHPKGVQWQTKIMRLGHLLRDVPVTPLITLRNPVLAIQSLYRELFSSLPQAWQSCPSLFAVSNAARVYDYPFLLRTLAQAGFARVRIIDFDKLCAGQVSEMDLFGTPSKCRLTIPHKNVSSVNTTIEKKSKWLSRPPCSSFFASRVKHYHSLQALVRQRQCESIRIASILQNV